MLRYGIVKRFQLIYFNCIVLPDDKGDKAYKMGYATFGD